MEIVVNELVVVRLPDVTTELPGHLVVYVVTMSVTVTVLSESEEVYPLGV